MSEMTFMISNLDELKKASLSITGPIALYIDRDYLDPEERTGTFDPTPDLEEVHFCYNKVRGVIAFVDEDIMYVIPYCEKVEKIIKSSGYKLDSYLKVPFIYDDTPLLESEKWENLKRWAESERSC